MSLHMEDDRRDGEFVAAPSNWLRMCLQLPATVSNCFVIKVGRFWVVSAGEVTESFKWT